MAARSLPYLSETFKSASRMVLPILILVSTGLCQSEPNTENGFKPYGTYSGSNIDTINLENGNLLLHIPMPFSYPQRGKVQPSYFLGISSKQWAVTCSGGTNCSWYAAFMFSSLSSLPAARGVGAGFDNSIDMVVTRSKHTVVDNVDPGLDVYSDTVSAINTADGSSHTVWWNGSVYVTNDVTGYLVVESNPDTNGIFQTVTARDRAGNVYLMGPYQNVSCKVSTAPDNTDPNNPGTITTSDCTQAAQLTAVTDPNGNQITFGGQDTLNRAVTLQGFTNQVSTTDFSHCVGTPSQPISSAFTASYVGFNNASNQVKVCSSNIALSTNFGQTGVTEYTGGAAVPMIASVYFAVDGSTWSFQYDSYGNVTYIGLPLGGNIQYAYQTAKLTSCSNTVTYASRAVSQRTITDNNGNSYVWKYNYGTSVCKGAMTNSMTDPLGNDTVNVFNLLNGVNNGRNDVISYFVTSTKNYQGSQNGGNLLKEEDFQYYNNNLSGDSNTANSFVTQITTTMNGSVKRVVRTPDAGGYGTGMPIFGVVKSVQEYDFNNNLARETDTTYKWEGNSNYLNANMIGLPISVQVKNASGQVCAETDSDYDDPSRLTTYTGTTFNHVAPPSAVRGNPTSVSRKLSTTACSITASTPSVTSYTNWYDTGEVLSSTDPMGHVTTHTYDSTYDGAYPTQTCSPQTGTVTHCVSGAYDLGTGLLTSFIDANNQTSTFSYDNEGRMLYAKAPLDLAGQQPETEFAYPDLLTFQRTKHQDSSHSIIDVTYFDGLGRTRQTQLNDPEGNDTTEPLYDGLSRVVTMPNPHRSVTSSTDGKTTTYYDGLGRVVQVAPQDGTLLPANTPVTQCQSNNVCTDYSAFPVVTVKDQVGNQRRSRTDALGRLVEVDEPGPGANSPGTSGSGSINVSGSLAVIGSTSATPGKGWVTIGGTNDVQITKQSCHLFQGVWTCTPFQVWDTGTVTVTVNGYQVQYNPYGQNDTSSTVANYIYNALNAAASPVTATLNGTTINLTSKASGSATNYTLSVNSFSAQCNCSSPSFPITSSGANLTGGADATTTYDSGTMTVTVNGFQASAPYGQSSNSTASAVATALTNSLNGSGSPVTASLSGTTITITANTVGTITDYSVTGSSNRSFTASSTTLAGGTNPGGFYAQYVTTYSYDILGNLTGVNQAGDGSQAARVRSFTYDTLSRLLTSTNPESGTITYTYDSDGNMITKTDARGITINYSPSDAPIDGLHRVLKKTYSNGDTPVTYTYDQGANGNGRLSSEALGSITRSFSYDPLGRVVGQTDCLPSGCHTTAVPTTQSGEGYNLASELVSLNYPDGRNVTSAFSAAGRITSVNLAAFNGTAVNLNYFSVPQTTSPTTWGYLPTGSLTHDNYGNGLAETLGFNPRLQVNSISDVKGTTTLFSKSYGYNDASNHNNGNILTITDALSSAKNQTFTYDQLNRLATAAENDNAFNITYSIDPWGNMKESGTSNFNQAVDATNRMSGWSYDAAGNLLKDNLGHVYTYDAECRIKTVDGTVATYTYGPGGERVRKDTSTAGSAEYIYFGGGVIAELNPSSGAWTDYIFASSKRIAKDTSNNGSGAQYYQGDHLGSARIMTDASGTVISSCTFAPYGEQVSCSPDNAFNHYRFTGKERDMAESGLDYFGARYYSSSMGRFMTPDWAERPAPVPYANLGNPQTLNLYAYVDDNPINGVDAKGHSRQEYMVAGPAWGPNMMTGLTGDANSEEYEEDVDEEEAEENQQAQARGATYVIIVGEQGLTEDGHNVGNAFELAAKTTAAELEDAGNTVTIAHASNVSEFNAAINNNGMITGGVIYFGHGWTGVLYAGQDPVSVNPGANINSTNVGQLSNAHLGQNATIQLNSCNAGTGGKNSIAQAIANQLHRTTSGYNSPTFFGGAKCPKNSQAGDLAPSRAPVHSCPETPGRLITFQPQ